MLPSALASRVSAVVRAAACCVLLAAAGVALFHPGELGAFAARIASGGGAQQDQGASDRNPHLAYLRAALADEPLSTWREMRETLEDPDEPFGAKWRLFDLALHGPAELDQTIIDTVHAWGAAARPPAEQKPIEAWYLVRSLLAAASEDGRWRDALAASPSGRDLLVWVARGEMGMSESSNLARRLIVDLPVSAEERSNLASRVILNELGAAPDESLAPLLLPVDIASLREHLSRSLDEAGPDVVPNMSAAAALAHIGDMESLALIHRLATIAGRPRITEYAEWYAEMISLQHPPSRLVAFLESDLVLDPLYSGQMQWALHRADQLGVERQALRDAVHRAIARAGERPHAEMAVRSMVGNAIAIGLIDAAEVPKRLRPGPPMHE